MWENLAQSFSKNSSIDQLHRSAQFIAMTGKNYLEQQDDDSNTNMGWISENNSFAGHWIIGDQTFRLELEILDFRLIISGLNFNRIFSIEIDGKSREEIFIWLKSALKSLGMDTQKLKYIDHYQISEHETDSGATFEKPSHEDLNLISTYYSNADYLLRKVNQSLDPKATVRVWPHHFDIGTYISLGMNNEKALGYGMAIPDAIFDEFYFYQYGWSKFRDIDYSSLMEFPDSGMWVNQEWKGGALPISYLFDKENQEEAALNFYEFGREQLLYQI